MGHEQSKALSSASMYHRKRLSNTNINPQDAKNTVAKLRATAAQAGNNKRGASLPRATSNPTPENNKNKKNKKQKNKLPNVEPQSVSASSQNNTPQTQQLATAETQLWRPAAAPRVVFVSLHYFVQIWDKIPFQVLFGCLLCFNCKKKWLFPSNNKDILEFQTTHPLGKAKKQFPKLFLDMIQCKDEQNEVIWILDEEDNDTPLLHISDMKRVSPSDMHLIDGRKNRLRANTLGFTRGSRNLKPDKPAKPEKKKGGILNKFAKDDTGMKSSKKKPDPNSLRGGTMSSFNLTGARTRNRPTRVNPSWYDFSGQLSRIVDPVTNTYYRQLMLSPEWWKWRCSPLAEPSGAGDRDDFKQLSNNWDDTVLKESPLIFTENVDQVLTELSAFTFRFRPVMEIIHQSNPTLIPLVTFNQGLYDHSVQLITDSMKTQYENRVGGSVSSGSVTSPPSGDTNTIMPMLGTNLTSSTSHDGVALFTVMNDSTSPIVTDLPSVGNSPHDSIGVMSPDGSVHSSNGPLQPISEQSSDPDLGSLPNATNLALSGSGVFSPAEPRPELEPKITQAYGTTSCGYLLDMNMEKVNPEAAGAAADDEAGLRGNFGSSRSYSDLLGAHYIKSRRVFTRRTPLDPFSTQTEGFIYVSDDENWQGDSDADDVPIIDAPDSDEDDSSDNKDQANGVKPVG